MKGLRIFTLGIVTSFILMTYVFIDPVDSPFFPKCPFLMLTGLYCPGCGSQRAIHDILQGDFLRGISYNYLLIMVMGIILYQVYIFLFKFYMSRPVRNLLHNTFFTRGILIVVLLFWIARNIPYYPFELLAP